MKRLTWLVAAAVFVLLLVGVVVTRVGATSSQSDRGTNSKAGGTKNKLTLPLTAKEVASNVYYLGQAKDIGGRAVEGYAFVYKKNKEIKPAKQPKGGPSCYGYLARGAKWKTLENYIVNPDNSKGLDSGFVSNNLALDINKWETAAGKDIIGSEILGVVDGADTVAPDGKNEVYFADIDDPNTIAVTIVWGYFSGSPQTRALVEWDQVYDDVTYDWSANCSSENCAQKMDFENIATHELGHSIGMNDVYDSACSDVTMYGYADYGETKKRDLAQPDITGVYKLYNK